MLLLCCFIVSGSSFLWMARHKKTKNHTWTAHFIDKLPSSTMSFMEYQDSLDAQSQESLYDDLAIKKRTRPMFRFIDKAIHGMDMRDPDRFHQEPDIATLQYYQYKQHILTTLMSQTTPDPTKLRVWDEYTRQLNLSSVEPDLHQGGLMRDWNFTVF